MIVGRLILSRGPEEWSVEGRLVVFLTDIVELRFGSEAQRVTLFLIRLRRSVSCTKRDAQISFEYSTYPSWQKPVLLSLASLVLNR